jgi:hypothetical protein
MPNFSILRPSNIYQNWDFRFENVPSGNPGQLNSTTAKNQLQKSFPPKRRRRRRS